MRLLIRLRGKHGSEILEDTINEDFSFKRFIILFVSISVSLALFFTELTRFSLKGHYSAYYSSFSWQNLDELGWTYTNTFLINCLFTTFIGLATAIPFSFHRRKEVIAYVV